MFIVVVVEVVVPISSSSCGSGGSVVVNVASIALFTEDLAFIAVVLVLPAWLAYKYTISMVS